MTTEPKAFDPGPQQHGDEPITVKLPADFLPWQPGDVILDVGRNLYIRARQCDVEDGWPWCSGVSYAPADGTGIGEGGTADRQVQRPVTLLVRDGKPIGGMLIDDQAEAPAKCGHEFELGDVAYSCQRRPHRTGQYAQEFRHAAEIDEGHAEGTDCDDGEGPATLVTWGEDEAGDGQDCSAEWGTVAQIDAGEVRP